jgi:hypothetical protein
MLTLIDRLFQISFRIWRYTVVYLTNNRDSNSHTNSSILNSPNVLVIVDRQLNLNYQIGKTGADYPL